MPFRLIVQSALERHRPADKSLIAKMTFELRVGGSRVEPIASPQNAVAKFDVGNDADGTEVELHVRIPPLGAMTKPILDASQKFRIVRARSGPASGPSSPVLSPVAGTKGLLHPRFVAPRAIGAGRTMQILVEIDTTWLDLTEYAKAFALDRGRISAFAKAAKSRLIILENARGGGGLMATTWILLVPPAVTPGADRINVFLFFRPEITKPPDSMYKNTDDVPFANRFLRYAQAPSHAGRYFDPGKGFWPFVLCGFDVQLVASAKPVVMLFPMPHVTSFGAITTSHLTRSGSGTSGPSILDHLLRSLWADGALSPGASSAPMTKRLALGGFSLGGDICLESWNANREHVDELYLFDPGKGIPGSVASWLAANPTRRLRMMGCAYSETHALAIAASLVKNAMAPPANWFAKPGDPLFWYGPAYAKALSDPSIPNNIDSLDDAQNRPTTAATIKSNMFVTSFHVNNPGAATANAELVLTAKWSGQNVAPPSFHARGIGNSEAAAYLRYHIIDNDNAQQPVTSVQQFNSVCRHLQLNDFNEEQPRSAAVRHEWAVTGGEERGGTFVGHLQLCLEGSGFV
jgi:hypothetical protein